MELKSENETKKNYIQTNNWNYASAGPKSKTPIWLEQIIIALITNPHA